jgi:hypothetical protein
MNDLDRLLPAARQRTSNGRRRSARRRIAYTLTSNLFTVAPYLAGARSRTDHHTCIGCSSDLTFTIAHPRLSDPLIGVLLRQKNGRKRPRGKHGARIEDLPGIAHRLRGFM